METQNKTKKLGFYKVDNNPNGWKSIGVEGRLIEELTNNEISGIIMDYSYISGNNEFYLSLDYNEIDFKGAEKVKGWYVILVHGNETATLKKEVGRETVASIQIPWKDTRQYWKSAKKLAKYKEMGIEPANPEGIMMDRKLTPRGAIKTILTNLKALEQDAVRRVEQKIQSDKDIKKWKQEQKEKKEANEKFMKEWNAERGAQ